MKITIPTSTPYRKKDGTWDVKIVNEEVEIPDENLGRHDIFCSVCGNPNSFTLTVWLRDGIFS